MSKQLEQPVEDNQPESQGLQADLPTLLVHKPTDLPIEVKMNLPAWMLRDPGPRIEFEDDAVDWQEEQVQHGQ